ncbi:TTF-type domain-containing protein [Citrus sinensis]|uniref:TTF-type domain-containing protein n=1 Tax=Citrus sinensis TaxID=2711 RepID=A0ACB8N4B3_CITSI|nr:TTF-type domain-containing protein [Citrus sinensis]
MGPCQPRFHNFCKSKFGQQQRRFNPTWFNKYENWLEYSISKNAAYCLCCYLFRPEIGEQASGEIFTKNGFSNWKKLERLEEHVGSPNSAHNKVVGYCEDLMKQEQHVQTFFNKHSYQDRKYYRIRLFASIDVVRLLLEQGLAFRGNYLRILRFLADHNEDIKKVTVKNAPGNNMLIAPSIQKDIVRACSIETTNAIIRDVGDALFSVLIDESRDASMKEQMAVVLQYVDKNGSVIECFIGLKHVTSTTAISLKEALDQLFSKHGLSISRLRGQGYDGASNMQGEFNGLRTLIMNENECAYYIHCFAHQLQLVIVAVAKKHDQVNSFLNVAANVVNVITLKRFGDTRWGSHYGTLLRIISLFPHIISVLEIVAKDKSNSSEQRFQANYLIEFMQSFDFVLSLYLMRDILALSNKLSQALQRKDQDILNAIKLASSFCLKHDIDVPNMNDIFLPWGRSRRKARKISNMHYFQVELFFAVLDLQLQELNNRFNEVNMELLLCLACLCPNDAFAAFDKDKLVRLAQFYPKDFSPIELMALKTQLQIYIMDMRSSTEFAGLKGISDLAKRMVETKKDKVYPLVYLSVTLALVLPVFTATVERTFSAMKFVKNELRNRMGDEWMNDNLIVYVEKDVFNSIDNESIAQCFHNMKSRREQL